MITLLGREPQSRGLGSLARSGVSATFDAPATSDAVSRTKEAFPVKFNPASALKRDSQGILVVQRLIGEKNEILRLIPGVSEYLANEGTQMTWEAMRQRTKNP